MSNAAVLCLASGSPRRRELLAQIGVPHVAIAADIDESQRACEAPVHYVRRMACEKAARLGSQPALRHDLPVLGADTAVVVAGRVLGKPHDPAAAAAMLQQLSAGEHQVFSAVALWTEAGCECLHSETRVRFREISPAEMARYAAGTEPLDKAGGYAIQGFAAVFVESLTGSYSGVMGLPLFETAQLLDRRGIGRWQPGSFVSMLVP